MIEDWRSQLKEFFTNLDSSKYVLERSDGREFQFGGIKENKILFKEVQKHYSEYFSKPGDLGACLIYLKTHSVEELLDILECPVCHKFNKTFRMNNSRGDKYYFCSKECRYSKEGAKLNMANYKEKTGYDNPYANPEVQQKRRENFKKKYGVNTPMELREFVEKNHESNRQNHGGILACQTEDFINHVKFVKQKSATLNVKKEKKIVKDRYLTEEVLAEWLKIIFPDKEFIHEKEIGSYKPDYVCEDLKMIVDFDGINHYQSAVVIQTDKKKDEYLQSLGYKVIRIPFFVQMSSVVIKNLFRVDIEVEQEYPQGFVSSKTVGMLPASFCCGGIKRFENDLKRFSYISDEVIDSLLDKEKRYGTDVVFPYPDFIEKIKTD